VVLPGNVLCTIGWLSTSGEVELVDLPQQVGFGAQHDTAN